MEYVFVESARNMQCYIVKIHSSTWLFLQFLRELILIYYNFQMGEIFSFESFPNVSYTHKNAIVSTAKQIIDQKKERNRDFRNKTYL